MSTHENLARLYFDGIALYRSGGLPRGASTGWKCLDELYTVSQGQWTVVTGTPQSGKSEWLDAVLVNLAEADPSWLFALYSPENWPTVWHLAKLVEKRIRKPFSPGITPRMTETEFTAGAQWVLDRFFWLAPVLRTPDELIATAMIYGSETRKLGVVLDPWNTLDHERGGMNETDYIALILTQVTRMAREANAHVWLVVHPAKIPRNKDGTRPVPTPYDISGSAHWYNKADNIITVHRDQTKGQDVEIHVQKVRFKNIGHVGAALLKYDKPTGRYFDLGHPGIEGETYIDPERGRGPSTLDETAVERAAIQSESA